MDYQLVRNAKVGVTVRRNSKNHPIAVIDVNGKFEHEFLPTSRVSRSLDMMTADDLAARLTGGTFFFVNNDLVDFRDGHYNGFIHDDKSIAALVDTIGIEERTPGYVRLHDNLVQHKYILGAKWSKEPISVPQYNDGGQFSSELYFGWNPFVQTINSALMLWRLICTNGMRGMSRFLNAKIPLVNRWEEHLNIANKQIQNKVNDMVTARLAQMGRERATVQELMTVTSYANERLHNGNKDQPLVRERLYNIRNAADPLLDISCYRDNVFTDSRIAAQVPGHLTTFDVYNLATEIRSHSEEVEGSSTLAIDRFANDLIFNRKDKTQKLARYVQPRLSAFSDPDQAFFGTLN